MLLTRQQEDALRLAEAWLSGGNQVFRLFGFAGTGKTTLARLLGATHYAAFTGKAAYVLRSMGCPNATTIHSLIYTPRTKSAARLRELEEELEKHPQNQELLVMVQVERANVKRPSWTLNLGSELRYAKLLVIDECSMVDEVMGEDLLSFGCKVLVLGDPAQLPPVAGGGFFTNQQPDVLLTEVHRQARDNPILDLATIIRETGQLPDHHELIYRGKVTPQMGMTVDQLIVGRNATRHAINKRMRYLLGRMDPLPVIGDKVVCTRNNHDIGLLNGAVYQVTDIPAPGLIELDNDLVVEYHPELFLGQELEYWREDQAQKFEYGYALTCHKAQGSQWDSVGIMDESGAFPKAQRASWLYTAVTRAAKTLWVAAKPA